MSTQAPENREAAHTDVVRSVAPLSTHPAIARGADFTGRTMPLSNGVFDRISGTQLRGFSGGSSHLAPLAKWGDQSALFESNLNRHVQQVTNGAVSKPMVVLLNTADPKAAEHQVTRFLGDNGISWQQLNEPASEPFQLGPGNDAVMNRRQIVQVQLKARATSTPAQEGPGVVSTSATPSTRRGLADSLEIVSKGSSAQAEVIQQQQSPARSKQLILARNLTASQVRGLNACVAPLQPVLLGSQVERSSTHFSFPATPSNGARAAATRAWSMDRGASPATSPTRDRGFDRAEGFATSQPATAPAALRAGDLVGLSTGASTEIVIQTIDDKGQISVPNLGLVKVEGSTPAQGIDAIVRACRDKGVTAGNVSLLRLRSLASTQPVAGTQPVYTFKPGDRISVEYDYANPDLYRTPEVTVDESGAIRLPLLGEFQSWGQTADQLARSIADAASRFDAGRAMFTVKSKDSSGRPVVASAATTRPAADAAPSTLPAAVAVTAASRPVTQPGSRAAVSVMAAPAAPSASRPVNQPALSLDDSAAPLQAVEAMVDVVIVVQPDSESTAATTALPAIPAPASQSFELTPTPATAPTSAPAR